MSIYQRLRIATLAKVREQEIALLNDPYYAADHKAIREGLQRLDAEIKRRNALCKATSRYDTTCPRCQGSTVLDHRVCIMLYGDTVPSGPSGE